MRRSLLASRFALFGVLFAASTSAVVIAACSGDGGDTQSTASHGATGAGGSTGALSGSGGDMFGDGGPGSTSSGLDPDAACATSSAEATLVPVNMFIIFDKSGSMDNNNKWTDTTAAMTAFFQDPASAGLRVALRFFPTNDCDDPSCDINACSQPAVPLAPLTVDAAPMDAQEGALIAAIGANGPGGGTPMFAALGGAEAWGKAYAAANPTEKVVVILVTDGEPNGCNNDINAIAGLATDGNASGVLTYAVGLAGSNDAQMNQIAQAGGTMNAILIGNGNAQQDLLNALKAIQGSQVACEFAMPASNNGDPIDPTLVNVNYTPGGGGMTQTLVQVASAADCTAKGGWYYDDPKTPTKVTLCPATCSTVQADQDAKIQLLFGCKTMVN